MQIALSLAYGLLTATGFGTADFVAKLSTDRVGFLRTALLMQIIGGFLLIPFALPDVSRLFLQTWATLAGVLLAVINAGATLALYRGFEVGRLSVVSPIASCAPAISVLLAVTFLGETLTGLRFLAICLVLSGIILVCIQGEEESVPKGLRRGAIYAIIFMVLGGSLFFGLKPVSHVLGVYVPVLLIRWIGAPILAIAAFLWKPKGAIRPSALSFISVIAILDTFANVTYNIGVSVGTVSIVATIAGLFSAVTVLLAWTVLKERLTRHQIVGYAVIIAGITILGLYG